MRAIRCESDRARVVVAVPLAVGLCARNPVLSMAETETETALLGLILKLRLSKDPGLLNFFLIRHF